MPLRICGREYWISDLAMVYVRVHVDVRVRVQYHLLLIRTRTHCRLDASWYEFER